MESSTNRLERIDIRKATENELESVVSLYQSAAKREGCSWNEFYPTIQDAKDDFINEGLYVALIGEEIIGAVSVGIDLEIDNIKLWRIQPGVKVISRLVVSEKYEGLGYGRLIMKFIIDELIARGERAIHLLVARYNNAAIAIYKKLGFKFLGECNVYDDDYYACELIIGNEVVASN